MWDVAVIGAGMSGLICARRLKAAGYEVCVLDKSRGLGGRMATRRVSDTVRVDHGARYWHPKTEVMAALTDELLSAGVIKSWRVNTYELWAQDELKLIDVAERVYAAPRGMSAIAKYLARDFHSGDTLLNGHRAIRLARYETGWKISCEGDKVVMAKRIAIAIPAPQAAELLATCELADRHDTEIDAAIEALRTVEYNPCITVLAGYEGVRDSGQLEPTGWMVTDRVGTSTDWIGLDSSKRLLPGEGENTSADIVLVIHSKPDFARRYLDNGDLQPAASVLLRASARKYCDWMAQPDWFQIHRWRYAQIKTSYAKSALVVAPSLVCGGDWCVAGDQPEIGLESAYLSGQAMAIALQQSDLT